jgi:MFS family permease
MLPFISMLMGMTISAAGVAGPLIGGAFARNATWRWIFWMK